MSLKYNIKNKLHLLKDEESVKFHVTNNDYFGTIATVISLLKQGCKKINRQQREKLSGLFDELEKDLLILQKNYQISAKTKNIKRMPKGKLKSQ